MPDRSKSNEGGMDSRALSGAQGKVSQAGRSGGPLPRDIGTEDELKRAAERPAGKTRVTKSDEREDKQ